MELRNQKQQQQPAKTSSKANVRKRRTKRRAGCGLSRSDIEQQALMNAVGRDSVANYPAILEGFTAKGIPEEEIIPRENVFTFNAWKALGRVVCKGQSGVAVVTLIPCTKKDKETGEMVPVNKCKRTTVFHISQTQPITNEDSNA